MLSHKFKVGVGERYEGNFGPNDTGSFEAIAAAFSVFVDISICDKAAYFEVELPDPGKEKDSKVFRHSKGNIEFWVTSVNEKIVINYQDTVV